jgi:hypothetical protein
LWRKPEFQEVTEAFFPFAGLFRRQDGRQFLAGFLDLRFQLWPDLFPHGLKRLLPFENDPPDLDELLVSQVKPPFHPIRYTFSRDLGVLKRSLEPAGDDLER